MKITYVIIVFLLAFNAGYAQVADSVSGKNSRHNTINDSIVKSPRRASIYSAVLPGLGQIYNRKIWKVPIVYVGLGGFGYFAWNNQHQFSRFKTAYLNRQNGFPDEFDGLLSDQGLLNEMDRFRRYRDLNILGFLAIYALQIVDANVDANLFDFDVSDDLSFHLSPFVNPGFHNQGNLTGVLCVIKF